jgi:aspartyl-tRNA(Asn)/glutamyl-tRNA(Gln) amidotransferase subunit C
MSFTQDDVKKLAYLARLTVDHSIVEDLSNILQLVDQIKDIDTSNVVPMDHSQTISQRKRPDVVTEPDVREAMQSCVPADAKAAGLYLVPKVVE